MSTVTTVAADKTKVVRSPTMARYLKALKSAKGLTGLTMLLVLGAAALLAPVIYPSGYDVQTLDALMPPTRDHLFGTDEFGRDILVRGFYGLGVDLSLVLTAVPLSALVGTIVGLFGVISETIGTAMQRVFDVIAGFPGLILGICMVAILGPGWKALFLAILVSGLPSNGRLARSAWISQQSREYVLAARVLGVSKPALLARHVLPNAMDSIIVNASVWMVIGIYIEAGLSIVGLGIQPPLPSLGVLLNNGLRYVLISPTYVIGPAILLVLLSVGFSLVADAVNEAVTR